jgi:hypothetical protein
MTSPGISELQAAVAAGQLTGGTLNFAQSLLRASRSRRGLTPKQAAWVPQLVTRATTPPPAPIGEALAPEAGGIFALFESATAHGLKWPKIHLVAQDGSPVVFSRAGSRSRYEGQVMVTDGGRFGANRYYGRIDTDGRLYPAGAMGPSVRALVEAFAADPATVAATYGRQTGSCCFCSLQLTTDESLAVGYGPVCAKKFGLPWGGK